MSAGTGHHTSYSSSALKQYRTSNNGRGGRHQSSKASSSSSAAVPKSRDRIAASAASRNKPPSSSMTRGAPGGLPSQPSPRMGKVAGEEAMRYSEDFDMYSKLAKRTRKRRKITKLRWSDLHVGRLLGEGNFSHVYEVTLRKRKKLDDGVETVVTDAKTIINDLWNRENQPDSWSIAEDIDDIWDLVSRSGGLEDDESSSSDDTDDEEEEEEEEEAVYALKHLHPQMTHKQRDFTASAIDLVLEAKLLGCLDHDNIVKLYGVTKGSLSNVFASSGYFLLLDRLHGTLEDKIQDWIGLEKMKHLTLTDKSVGAEQLDLRMKERSKLVDQRLGSVGLDVARGMEYLHRHRIIFRDLKPSNVGFGPDGTAKIFDFGLAREVIDSKRRMTGNTGSLRYMAPEVNRREHYGLSADIYSYGVMLWEMCTLHKPYKGMNKEEHAEMVIHKGFRPKINAVPGSPELKKLIQACWSANAQHRPNFTYVRRALLMELDVKKKMAELEELERQKRETPKSLRMKLKRQKRGKEASSGKPRRSKTSSSRPMATATNHQGSGGV